MAVGWIKKKTDLCPYQNIKKCDVMSIRLDTIPALDRQTDRFAITVSRSICTECWRALIKQAVREAAQYASPLYAARCSPAPAHTRLTPVAPSAPCAMSIHDRHAAARSGRWCRNWCRPYKSCSDLNSQPKGPGDFDLWPFDLESGVRVWRGLPLCQF